MSDVSSWEPLPLRVASAAPEAVPALLAWAADGGAAFEPIELRVDAAGNRSVYARRAVAAGAPLVVVPRRLMITDVDLGGDEAVAAVRGFDAMMHSRHSPMALWLARARAVGAGPWTTYLDALPQASPWVPAFRPASALAPLAGTFALDVVREVAAGYRDDHDLATTLVAELADLPLAEFAWGRAIAASRCFRIASADGGARALVPVADMFDHGRVDATWAYDDSAGAFTVRAARALDAGQEIQISYGAHDNAKFVASYGFAVDGNPEDEVALDLTTATGVASAPVGTIYDHRFHRAFELARIWPDGPDAEAARTRLAAAAMARRAAIALASTPADVDPAWARTCAVVRAGECAILDAVVTFVTGLTAADDARAPAAWRDVAAAIPSTAVGVDRLRRSYALVAAGELP
ncbi:MAG: SET domain-containing protein [Myxococcales bacterium]|nr:SET domain-containing protein [Myxococcales bacterium]